MIKAGPHLIQGLLLNCLPLLPASASGPDIGSSGLQAAGAGLSVEATGIATRGLPAMPKETFAAAVAEGDAGGEAS
jgi:hypothetical protein